MLDMARSISDDGVILKPSTSPGSVSAPVCATSHKRPYCRSVTRRSCCTLPGFYFELKGGRSGVKVTRGQKVKIDFYK